MERPFASVTVTEKAARALRGGHPWVFAGGGAHERKPLPGRGDRGRIYRKGPLAGRGVL